MHYTRSVGPLPLPPKAARVTTVKTVVCDSSGRVLEIVKGKTAHQIQAEFAKTGGK